MRSMVGRWLADYHHNDRRHEERGHELGAARLHMGLFSGGLLWLQRRPKRQEAQLIHSVGSTSRCSRDFVYVTFSLVVVIARASLRVARRACMASHVSLSSGLR